MGNHADNRSFTISPRRLLLLPGLGLGRTIFHDDDFLPVGGGQPQVHNQPLSGENEDA
jgi:hypothetical protein